MEKLQELSLVSKVCQALENHLGMSDKTLAEFVIDLVRGSSSCAAFLASIKKDELPLPPRWPRTSTASCRPWRRAR